MPEITALTPMLGVTNVLKQVAFYEAALGFKLERTYQPKDQVLWALAQCGALQVMFYFDPAKRAGGINTTTLYFNSGDVVGLHRKLAAQGHQVTPLRVTFYKMKEFGLTDPEGYEWLVGEPTDEPPTDGS